MPEKKITAVEVSEDIQKLFWDKINTTELERMVTFDFLSIPKLKEVCKVEVPSEKSTLKQKTGIDVFILVDEAVFNGLNPETKLIIVEECIGELFFNDEKGPEGKLEKIQKDVKTFSGVIAKFGDKYLDAIKNIKDIQSHIADKEKQDLADAKGKEIKA